MPSTKLPELIEFNRPRKYRPVRILGNGACGETVLIRDEDMGVDLVAKKYKPIISKENEPALFNQLLDRFRDEARMLFQLNHPNVVRVFNYYDYRDSNTSYIIMEYVSGKNILDFIKNDPVQTDKIFEKVINGFSHLERRNILHRDIRPMNILVSDDGDPKIIDFGFGKQIDFGDDGNKSISLNWLFEPPPEFAEAIYDFQTEIYFVGKLFEMAIQEGNLSDFKYLEVVRKMCELDRNKRFSTFSDLQSTILKGKFNELDFTKIEIQVYRDFSDSLSSLFISLHQDAIYHSDASELVDRLENLYRATMLEEYIQSPSKLGLIFVNGSFRYHSKTKIEVAAISKFLQMLKSLPGEKRAIAIANIFARLDAVPRFAPDYDDDIPF